jgi:hypothetical protein
MNIKMQVDTGTGPRELQTTLWAVVQWERKFKVKASDMAKGMGMEDLVFLAYCSEQAAGNPIPAVFDDYVRKVRTIDVIGTDDETPTQGAPTGEN